MKLSELKSKLNLSQNDFTNLLHRLNLDPLAGEIEDTVAQQLIDKAPSARKLKAANTHKKPSDPAPKTSAEGNQEGDGQIRSMSLDTSALDVVEMEELEKLAAAIDSAREARIRTDENQHAQQESLASESLVQADIEGELSGELEGITYLQAHHRGKQKVLREYSQFQEENHNKTVQAILKKYQEINSQPSEDIARQTAENYAKKLQLRKAILSRRV